MFGVMLAIFVLFLIMLSVISVLDKGKEVVVEKKTVLQITLDKPIKDRSSSDPFENFDLGSFSSNKILGLNEILKNIKKATADDNIAGIYLDISTIATGIASVGEIRDALQNFKDSSDKFIICYSEMISQKAYYLGSVADEVYLNPEGYLMLTGLATGIPFFKGALEKLEIEAQIIRHGKFKSAVEPFMLDKMSEANREQSSLYVNSIWNRMLEEISESRGLSIDQLNLLTDSLFVGSADQALEHKIVDKLLFKDEVLANLKERLELEEDEDINFMSIGKYDGAPKPKRKKKGLIKDRIAIVYAEGGIVTGDGEADEIGSDRISKAIKKARLNDKVKAIVLRVNSGGGSALASDVIWREMMLAKEVKPVVASMGNVAASGGYYISCAADTIVASQTTITGSIGVLGILFNMKDFFKNKLGITFDGVKSNDFADLGTPTRPLTEYEKKVIKDEIERIYDVFITHVADGRNMTKAEVDSIGQGRVWSGVDAMRIGLIDVFGGLETAVAIAAEMAELEEYRLLELPKLKDPIEQIVSELSGEAQSRMIRYKMGDNYKYYRQFESFSKMQGIQAVVPYDLNL